MQLSFSRMARRLAPAVIALGSWGLLTYSALSQSTRGAEREKIAQTTATLEKLAAGLFGDANGVGYIGDMGRLPPSLEELAAASGSPAYSTSNQGSVGMGFNGPYVSRAGTPSSAFVDAWGSALSLVSGNGEARLRSSGPDRDSTTDEDNVYYPIAPRTTHGSVEVTVTSVPAAGGAATPLDDSAVDVRVYYASNGTQASAAATYAGSGGVFRLLNVHVGRHYVSVTARDADAYEVSSGSDVVTLRGKKASTAIRLVAKTETEAETETVLCHTPGGANQTLSVPESALAAHLAHGDTLGACTASGGEDEGKKEEDDEEEKKKEKKEKKK